MLSYRWWLRALVHLTSIDLLRDANRLKERSLNLERVPQQMSRAFSHQTPGGCRELLC